MNRQQLLATIERQEARFNPELNLIRVPLTATYHTALKPDRHPEVYFLLESVVYAFQLLNAGEPADAAKAARILRKVLPLQDQDPSRATYGIWSYFYEETLDEMDRPDWNMADFHGKLLCLILNRHAELLPADLLDDIRSAVAHACKAIIKRNVGPGYTNIAIMGAFVTLVGGEILGDEEVREYGLQRLKRFYTFTKNIGTFSEYNSPCYTPIAIRELHAIYAESRTLEAVSYATELMDLAWKMTAEHYHAATGEWSGPHSRTYHTLLQPSDRQFLEEALLDETFEFGENIRCPKELRPLFASTEERSLTIPTLLAEETGYQVYATLYKNEALSLGTFSQGVMWNQRRNLLGYVSADGQPVYVQLQFLKDGLDFCSAMYTGVQLRTDALFGFNLLTDNGAWHSDLDIIEGRFQAGDLRIRLKVGGAAATLDSLEAPEVGADKSIGLQLGDHKLAVRPIWEQADYGELTVQVTREADALHLDYVIYSGDVRDFDFHAVQQAVWLFALSLGGSGTAPAVAVADDASSVRATMSNGTQQTSICLLRKPGPTLEMYKGNEANLPLSGAAVS